MQDKSLTENRIRRKPYINEKLLKQIIHVVAKLSYVQYNPLPVHSK